MSNHKQRIAIPVLATADRYESGTAAMERMRATFADLHTQLDAIESAHGPTPELVELRTKVRAADPDRTVRAALTHTDAVVGAAQLRTLTQLFADRMPAETTALLERIAAALGGAK